MLTEELINILACPQCKGPLSKEEDGLYCPTCLLVFPIENEVPILLVEKAVNKEEKSGNFENQFMRSLEENEMLYYRVLTFF